MPAAASARASSPPRPNTSGSPPFSRTTRKPLAGKLDQPVVDPQLLGAHAAGAFARHLQPRLRRQRQDRLRHQRVVHDDIRLAQRIGRVQRQQARDRQDRRPPARPSLDRSEGQ